MTREEAFWVWWQKIESYKESYNLRMAFDEGFNAGKESQ